MIILATCYHKGKLVFSEMNNSIRLLNPDGVHDMDKTENLTLSCILLLLSSPSG